MIVSSMSKKHSRKECSCSVVQWSHLLWFLAAEPAAAALAAAPDATPADAAEPAAEAACDAIACAAVSAPLLFRKNERR